MERLIKKIGNRIVFPPELVGVTLAPDNETMHRLLFRLAAYEDSGLDPEEVKALTLYAMGKAVAEIKEFDEISTARLRELAQAEKDGRLVVLPCKVGDTVYRVTTKKKYLNNPKNAMYIKGIVIKPENFHKYIHEIGKTVFLTREEAEAALKGESNETDSV